MTLSRLSVLQFHDFVPGSVHQPVPETARMVSLRCRDPDVRGYSACWQGSVLYLHAHREGEDMGFYGNFPSNSVWIHMSVEPGEFITDIWARRGRMYRDMALLVSKRLLQFFVSLLTV